MAWTKPFKALKSFLFFTLAFSLLITGLAPDFAHAKANPRYAAIVMDADTGAILSQEEADKKRHPASLTKVMTLLLLFDALDSGRVSLYDRIPISRRAAAMVPSKIGLKAGATIKVQDAIYAIVTKSANDIAVAVAEYLGRSESNFAGIMTNRARSIGMTNTVFKNASGLHEPGQVTTARDMAQMARYVILQYPEYYRYYNTRSFYFQGQNHANHNRLMSSYKGMDGMKTGYVNASGFNLIASAVRGNKRLIGVVFGGRSAASRNAQMARLLDQGFKTAGDLRIASGNVPYEQAEQVAALNGMGTPPLPGRKPLPQGITAMTAQIETSQAASPSVTAERVASAQMTRSMAGEERIAGAAPVKNAAPQTVAARQNPPTSKPSVPSKSDFDELIGQGDYDLSEAQRFETGLITVSAVKGAKIAAQHKQELALKHARAVQALYSNKQKDRAHTPSPALQQAHAAAQDLNTQAATPEIKMQKTATRSIAAIPAPGTWSIQVGAFGNRAATDQALYAARKKIPHSIGGQAMIAPLKTKNGWLYRARFGGYTKEQAFEACRHLSSCLPIAPKS